MRAMRSCPVGGCTASRSVCLRPVLPCMGRPVAHARVRALPDASTLSDLHHHAAALLDLADAAAVAAAPGSAAAAAATTSTSGGGGIFAAFGSFVDTLETVLKTFDRELDRLHVPYSYGWSIVLLTLCVKILTFPLTKKQVESSLAVQSLKPRVDMIRARYGDQAERIKRETNLLYEQAGVNPLAGCLPSLGTIPVFIGLYRSLTNAAAEGVFDTEGFYWIPSLAGPTSMAANKAGAGIAWLYPLVDGVPPIGWHDAQLYCILPVLLVLCQYVSSAVITPPIDPNAENANTQKVLYVLLPLWIGWFALNVPSGLGLYYLSNTALTTLIQVWLRKLGGADVKVNELGPITKVATGRRLGALATEAEVWTPPASFAAADAAPGDAAAATGGAEQQPELAAAAAAAAGEEQSTSRSSSSSSVPGVYFAKRKRRAGATAAA